VNRRYLFPAGAALAVAMAGGTLGAQTAAYTQPPPLTSPARLVVPKVTSSTLQNGVQLRVVEQHELPLVQVTLTIPGGSRLDGQSPGLASFMATMLDEGAGSRDAVALQSELAYLGANLSTSADWDRVTISLKTPLRSLAAALDILADVTLRPTFAAAEVRRQRDLRLTSLLQLRDQPAALASLAFNQVLYPPGHPYHRSAQGDSASVAAFDSARVRDFHSRVMRPERATVTVVGDITEAQARQHLGQRLGAWRAAGAAAPLPAADAAAGPIAASRLYYVDKPDAAQSVIIIGWPGVDRKSPDYAALSVMNTLLGGSFSSRLNTTLRETRGYTYGAGSGFAFRVVPGPFTASAAVRTNVTDSSLVEFFRELRAIRDSLVPPEELARGKAYVELGLPSALESTTQVASQLAQLGVFGLTLDELPRFADQVRGVTAADVQRVARQYLTPDRAIIVVVGDLARIRGPVDALKLGPAEVLDVKAVAK
jgi:predicted Zn-dependent peptidase